MALTTDRYDTIVQLLKRKNCELESREICIQDPSDPEACINAYAIVQIGNSGTQILRVELWDGTILDDFVQVECDNCSDSSGDFFVIDSEGNILSDANGDQIIYFELN